MFNPMFFPTNMIAAMIYTDQKAQKLGKKACWPLKIGRQIFQPMYLGSSVLDKCPSRIDLHFKIMFSRLNGLELYVSTTIFDLNMATSECFYQKTT